MVLHQLSILCGMQSLDGKGDEELTPQEMTDVLAASHLSTPRVQRSRVKFSNFQFRPVSGWVTAALRERINSMDTEVWTRSYILNHGQMIVRANYPESNCFFSALLRHGHQRGVKSSAWLYSNTHVSVRLEHLCCSACLCRCLKHKAS
jgi:hypothetical protein